MLGPQIPKNRMWGGDAADLPIPHLHLLLANLFSDPDLQPQPWGPRDTPHLSWLSRNGPCPVPMAHAGSGRQPSLEKPCQTHLSVGSGKWQRRWAGWAGGGEPVVAPHHPQPLMLQGQTQETPPSLQGTSSPDVLSSLRGGGGTWPRLGHTQGWAERPLLPCSTFSLCPDTRGAVEPLLTAVAHIHICRHIHVCT